MAKKKFITKAEAGQIFKFFGLCIDEYDLVYSSYLHITKTTEKYVDIRPTKYPDIIYLQFYGFPEHNLSKTFIFQASNCGRKRYWSYKEPVYDESKLWDIIEKLAYLPDLFPCGSTNKNAKESRR